MITKKQVSKLTRFLVGLVAVLCLVVLFLPASLAVAQTVSVSVNAPASVAPGDYFTARVNISSVTDFDTADFRVVFDSSVLEIEDITPGADITDGLIGTTTIPVVIANEVFAGTVRVVINVPGFPGVTGSGYLCQIQFYAIGTAEASSTINLQKGTLGDKYGDAIVATWTGTTVSIGTPDITPPTVTNKSPVGSDVAVASDISVTFSEAMNQASAQSAFSTSPSVSGSFSWAGNTMTFNPGANLAYGTEYTVTMAGTAQDLAGSGLDGNGDGVPEGSPADDYSWSFTTEEVIHAVAAEFSASPTVGVAPLEVQFIDQSTGDIDSWLWDFGDGSSSTSENPTHTYVGTGEYTVTLTVSGPDGSDVEEKVDYIAVISSEEAETQAIFSASDLLISPQQVQPDQQVEVSINIANNGGATGSHAVILYINGNQEDSHTVSISPGSTQNVVFTVSRSTPGTYEVLLEGLQGQFTVLAPPGTSSLGGLDTGTLIVIVAIIVALIAAIVFVIARIRRG